MAKYQLSTEEKDILKVIKTEIEYAQETPSLKPVTETLDANISDSEALLKSIGYGEKLQKISMSPATQESKTVVVRSFEELLKNANDKYPEDICFEYIFTKEELLANTEVIARLNDEFNTIHKLDEIDVLIPAIAGVLSGTIDCILGGFVKSNGNRMVPGSMTEFVNNLFNKALPVDKIEKLESLAKVPYDALNYNNKGNVIVQEIVDGLSPMFHHNVALGHDPILGFIFGVLDMMRGSVTTLDFNGEFLIQFADGYSDRKAQNLFQAIATVFLHLLSDVNGSSSAKNGGMGLPVPFMALFNKMQFGKIGDNETIAELVKSMFYQGYDFRHFCAMSLPVMINEVVVRVAYFAKRLNEGYSFAESVPIGSDHTRKPKLGTMLFIAHSASTAINAGKVAFTQNPLNINYPQWLSFARLSIKQLKWSLVEKPTLRDEYVMGILNGEWTALTENIDNLWSEYTDNALIIYV